MIPRPLQINTTLISFPYLNKEKNIDPVNRLLVDICEGSKISENSYTVSLKYAYSQYYKKYDEYLQLNNKTSLQNEILIYYQTIIETIITYKYKVGQFGYLLNGSCLEDSFICITEISKKEREIFFLHSQLRKYKYILYDITSPKPKKSKIQKSEWSEWSEWIFESEFVAVNGAIDIGTISDSFGSDRTIIKLLNWKTYREDYLTRKLHEEKTIKEKQLSLKRLIKYSFDGDVNGVTTSTDDTVVEYVEYDEYEHEHEHEYEYEYDDTPITQIEKHGYNKEKHLCYTIFGEIFTAWTFNNNNKNKKQKEELVAIKKFKDCDIKNSNVVIDKDLIREALILRRLKAKNTFLSNSIVNYIDFFEGNRDYYIVMELNFNLGLKEFVDKSHEYIKTGRLSLNEYQETIKYLLWRLAATINFLHEKSYVKCCDLDICLENIMLSKAEFVKKGDNSVGINLMIEIKFVDFSVRELLEISNYHKIKEFKSKYNEKYLSLGNNNNKYLSPNAINNNCDYKEDLCANDMWSVGIVVYYCFFGNYPAQLYNGKINQELEKLQQSKGLNEHLKSLLNGLLNIEQTKRLKSIDVIQHPFFNSFYKAYLSICDKNYLNK